MIFTRKQIQKMTEDELRNNVSEKTITISFPVHIYNPFALAQHFGMSLVNVGWSRQPDGRMLPLYTATDWDHTLSSNSYIGATNAIYDLFLQLPCKQESEAANLQLRQDVYESVAEKEDE